MQKENKLNILSNEIHFEQICKYATKVQLLYFKFEMG